MKKKGVGRPRDGNPEETRQEILLAAQECFAAAGFVGATTRLVAARAGVNVATLHYHFGSKEGLYRAALESASAGPLPQLSGAGSPAERLTRAVEALYAFEAERPGMARLSLLDALAGPAKAPQGKADGRVAWLQDAISSALPAGASPSVPTEEAARIITALIDVSVASTDVVPRSVGAAGADGPEGPADKTLGRRAAASLAATVAAALRVTGLG